MNDDFNEQSTGTRLKATTFKWTKAGLNGWWTDIPNCPGHQIWCMFHPRRPNHAGWQICTVNGDMIFVDGIIEIKDVFDMRTQAEGIAKIWVGDKKKVAV